MKLLFPIAAALAVAVIATAAPAVDRVVHTTVVKTNHHDNGPHWRTKRVCKVSWHHHRRVKHCWTTRVRV